MGKSLARAAATIALFARRHRFPAEGTVVAVLSSNSRRLQWGPAVDARSPCRSLST